MSAADVCFILITDWRRNPRMLEANHDRFPSTLHPITHRALSAFSRLISKETGRVFGERVRANFLSGVTQWRLCKE